jgi:L-threonylcarbamoyladenylate synthase
MTRVTVNPHAPEAAALQEAAAAIARGEIVAFATDTLYGLAADPRQDAAVASVFAAKGRPDERALLLVAADRTQVEQVAVMNPLAAHLASRWWPGPLTLLLPARGDLVAAVHGGTRVVGVRVPASEVARALTAACGHPVTATSANRSGEPATAHPDEVARSVGHHIAVLLDSGASPGGPPSTIVDATGDAPKLIREGAVAWKRVLESVHRSQ